MKEEKEYIVTNTGDCILYDKGSVQAVYIEKIRGWFNWRYKVVLELSDRSYEQTFGKIEEARRYRDIIVRQTQINTDKHR